VEQLSDLKYLLNRQQITDLLARYCDQLDKYEIDEVADTFTVDAQADYGPGRGGLVIGRKAIRERIARGQSLFRRTHHQIGHSTITVDRNEASGITTALTWHELFSGEQELLALRYLDNFEYINKKWLISFRRVEISMVQGFEGTEWNWWERNQPEHFDKTLHER
tara:strand:+ start:255 stop:749 length:495 start_codon:yes stop_codon:yes gene_type:complete